MSPPPPLHWRPSIARRVLQDTTVVWAARRRLVRSRIAARPPVAALVRLIRAARWRLVRSRVSFDRASRRAPPLLLLFASSGRRKGDSFDRGARGGEGWYCQARGGDEQGVVRAARRRLVRSRVVARSHRSCCSRCPGGLFDRASRRAPPHAFGRLLGEGAQGERGGMSGFLEGGGWGDEGATEMVFFRCAVHANTHEFGAKKNPRQNSRDAVAWASYAPMPLHRQNRHGRTRKLPIIARSEPNGGGEVMNKMGRRAHLRRSPSPKIVFGLRFRKRGKPQEGLRKKKKKRQTARPRF